MNYLFRHNAFVGKAIRGKVLDLDQIDGSFGGFVFSLLPLIGLELTALLLIARSYPDLGYMGALLLGFVLILPLSIGPVFLGIVAFAREQQLLAYPLMVSFNWLRLRLVLPIAAISLGLHFAHLHYWLDISDYGLYLALAGGLYGLYCMERASRLIVAMLGCSRPLAILLAIPAICLAIL